MSEQLALTGTATEASASASGSASAAASVAEAMAKAPPEKPSWRQEAPSSESAPAPTAARGKRNTLVLLVFTAVTNLADGVTKIGLPLLATQASGSPGEVAAVSLALSLPWLLVALHVGVLVDRFDRRRLLWAADGVRLLALAVLIRSVAADGVGIPLLCGVGAVLGVAEVVALTTASALVPSLTPPEGRERANAWIAGTETVCSEFCGPFVGGLLLAAGTAVALGVTWVSYLAASALLFLLVGVFRAAPRRAEQAAPESVNRRIAEGLSHLWRHPLLRTMALVQTVLCGCWGGWLALMPLYATDVMGLDAQHYGVVLSALGIGGLAGALSVTWAGRVLGRRRVMFADLLGTFAMMAVPAVTTDLRVVAAAAFAGGLGGTLWTVNARTIGQRLVPDRMLGRYNAASRLFGLGAMPVGAGLIGVLAEVLGLRLAFAVFAVSVAVTVLPFLRVLTRPALARVFSTPPA